MKKSLLLAATLMTAAWGQAQTTVPQPLFAENFAQTPAGDTALPEGWITYGSGNVAASQWQQYFGDKGEAPFYRVFDVEGVRGAWSNTTYHYEAAGDEWLVTPVVHITSDSQVLSLKAMAYGSFETGRYRVLISEGGEAKEDFRPTLLLNTTLRGSEYDVKDKTSYVALNGYAGKDIRLAFVNKSQDCALLGFTDISISPYVMDVQNLTPSVLPVGTEFSIALNANVRTPMQVNGITVRLTAGNGFDETRTIEQTLDINGSRVAVSFDGFTVPDGGLDYTLTLTPAYEGAEPTVITGEVSTPLTSYAPVALIEEFTGTWCSNCPRGAAFMNYFADKYTGEGGTLKALGVALHSDDPMELTNPAYLNTAYSIAQAKGYPSAFFNRTTLGDPSDAYIVENTAATRSNSRMDIKRVDYTEGEPLTIHFAIENSYSMKNMNQRVAFVVVENKVHGEGNDYRQVNGLQGATKAAVINTYGEELWPYFEPFTTGAPRMIMDYEHVARGIFPDYYGELLETPCEAMVPIEGTYRFNMPEQVDKPENTAVIALLFDGNTGAVVGGAEVEAEHYNTDISGLESVGGDDFATVMMAGHTLSVDTPAPATVSVYAADGRLLASTGARAGLRTIDCSAMSGVVIVSVKGIDGSSLTRKFVL